MKTRKLNIRGKFILMFLALAILLSVGIGALAYTLNYTKVTAQYSGLARNAAELAADMVETDAIDRYLAQGEDESYCETLRFLTDIKESFGLRFLYVFIPLEDKNDDVVLFDVAVTEEEKALSFALGDHSGEVDVYEITLQVYKTGLPAGNAAITRSNYGYLISSYAPVVDAQGATRAVVGVDLDMNQIMREIRRETFTLSLSTAAVILLSLLGLLLVINRQIIRPVNALSAHMAAFDKNAADLEIQRFHTDTGDEIERMADSFNQMAEDIQQYVENLRAVTAEKERVSAELGVAKTIQASMLPSIFTFIPKREEFEIFATMEPAREVGGDFYDFFLVNGRFLAFTIADVSGKGVPAALFMVIAKTLLKNHALQGESPAEVLQNVNAQLCENNGADMFVTVFFGMIELSTGTLTFANAGHNQPLLLHDGAYAWFRERPGFVLAGMEGMRYRNYTRTLAPGDRLFLYTDGVTEALNGAQDLFTDARLERTLQETEADKPDLRKLLARVRAAIDGFAGGAEQADDITMLSIDWRGNTQQVAGEKKEAGGEG